MPNYRGLSPRFRWGTSYANAVDVASFDNVVAYSEPRDGSDFDMAPSGVEDSWYLADDYFVEGDLRWIPRADSLFPKKATGWDGASGVDAMLQWARRKNVLKFHPDGRNLVVSPTMGADADANGVVNDFASNVNGLGSTTTFSFDGTDLAQKVTVTGNATGATKLPLVSQDVGGIMAGETLTLSAEGRHQLSSALATAYVQLSAIDAVGATLATQTSASFLNSGSYSRNSVARTMPANTVVARVHFVLSIPATGSLTAWGRKMVLARNASDAASFIDNPSYDAYLSDPMKGSPSLESNKMRALHVKLRSAASPPLAFDGY